MKKIIILFLFLQCAGFVKAQQAVTSADTTIVDSPQVKAEFPGGRTKLYNFFLKNMHFPKTELEKNLNGKQIIKILIEKDGTISNIQFIQSADEGYDAESIRVIKKMPKFIPATVNGQPVRSYYTFPMSYTISNNG